MKKKIAFIKFAGLAAGGTETFLQTLAANLPKDKYEVFYFYTNAAPYIGSDWKHPDNDPDREAYMRSRSINLIKVNVQFKNLNSPTHDWVNTDFWEKYEQYGPFDLIQTARAGHSEYPFNRITDVPIIEAVTLAGMADNQPNIVKSFHCSKWAANEWVKAGGNPDKIEVVPLIKELPENRHEIKDLRNELYIPQDAFVMGFHQRNDDNIFSPIPLEAYAKVAEETGAYFIQMGGSKKYMEQAKRLNLGRFIYLPHSGDSERIFAFLNTLNLFTHGRSDGETYGVVIAEALSIGLPIISHSAPCMGHVETIGPCGKVCNTIDEYAEEIIFHFEKEQNRSVYGFMDNICSFSYFNNNLSVESTINKVVSIYDDIPQNATNSR